MTWNFYDLNARDATLLTFNIIRPMAQSIMVTGSYTNVSTVRNAIKLVYICVIGQ
jgi:hypothetical protein